MLGIYTVYVLDVDNQISAAYLVLDSSLHGLYAAGEAAVQSVVGSVGSLIPSNCMSESKIIFFICITV
jgi:hypothetical protein